MELKKLNHRYPGNELIYFSIGLTYALQEEHKKAEFYYMRAIDIDPLYAEALFNLGVLHKRKLDLYKSVIYFQKVCECSDDAELVGEAQRILNVYENIVIESDGTDLTSYLKNHETFTHAFTKMKQKNWKLAIESFQKVL